MKNMLFIIRMEELPKKVITPLIGIERLRILCHVITIKYLITFKKTIKNIMF